MRVWLISQTFDTNAKEPNVRVSVRLSVFALHWKVWALVTQHQSLQRFLLFMFFF